MRTLAIPVAAVTSLLSVCALGNPMMIVNDVYVEQVPGTAHVQITRTRSSGSREETTVSRDGKGIEVSFETTSGGSRDLGSGLASITIHLGCDCSVPAGEHTYNVAGVTVPVTVVDAVKATGTERLPSANCSTKCASTIVTPPPMGGATSTGSASGTSGGATGTGGATSTTSSSTTTGGASGPGEATRTTGGSATTQSASKTGGTASTTRSSETAGNVSASNTAPQNSDGDSSGCVISRKPSGLLPVGILVALGLLGFRRRK